ncbi:nuclease-related domain-containing protein [Roseiflexus castenholzii]|uniref:nuclease-related domain-containing protein n=1 Tax=Roseiflexus castenholzii TaxID=120962 RepID=UPI003C7B6312
MSTLEQMARHRMARVHTFAMIFAASVLVAILCFGTSAWLWSSGRGDQTVLLTIVGGMALFGAASASAFMGHYRKRANDALIGARAEQAMQKRLAALTERGFAVINDLSVRALGNIDHLVIAPDASRIWVIETKAYQKSPPPQTTIMPDISYRLSRVIHAGRQAMRAQQTVAAALAIPLDGVTPMVALPLMRTPLDMEIIVDNVRIRCADGGAIVQRILADAPKAMKNGASAFMEQRIRTTIN